MKPGNKFSSIPATTLVSYPRGNNSGLHARCFEICNVRLLLRAILNWPEFFPELVLFCIFSTSKQKADIFIINIKNNLWVRIHSVLTESTVMLKVCDTSLYRFRRVSTVRFTTWMHAQPRPVSSKCYKTAWQL